MGDASGSQIRSKLFEGMREGWREGKPHGKIGRDQSSVIEELGAAIGGMAQKYKNAIWISYMCSL